MKKIENKFTRGDAVVFFDNSNNRYFGRIVGFSESGLTAYVACPQGRMYVSYSALQPYTDLKNQREKP